MTASSPTRFRSGGGAGRGGVSKRGGDGGGGDVQDWVLRIKHVQSRDSGSYECQVTGTDESESGIKSHRVDLKVETPEAFILADEEYHIDTGSSLSLVCIIEKATHPPQYVISLITYFNPYHIRHLSAHVNFLMR